MNKTQKVIASLLLANLVPAGVILFCSSIDRAVPAVAMQSVPLPAKGGAVSTPNPVQNVPTSSWSPPQDEDLLACINRAKHLQAGQKRDEMLTAACFKLARQHPDQAVELADQFSLTKGGILSNLVQQWAQQDVQPACHWVMSKPASSQKNELLERICFVWAKNDPEGATQFVLDEIPPGSQQIEAAISVLHQWAKRDMTGATAWVQQFPEGAVRDRAIAELEGIKQYSNP